MVTEEPCIIDKNRKAVVCIERTLDEIFGRKTTQVILNYIEKRLKVKKDEIPSRMDEFEGQLEILLGNASKLLLNRIEKDIKTNASVVY